MNGSNGVAKMETGEVSQAMSIEYSILELGAVEAVKFGSFTQKSGLTSPVYFDLGVLVFYPKLLSTCAKLLLQAKSGSLMYGVPYTALPIVTIMEVEVGATMVVRRKEAKDYETKKMVEGVWKEGQNCLVVEDVVTTGGSVADTAKLLRERGITVTDCVVLLAKQEMTVHSVGTLSKVLEVLNKHKRITEEMAEKVRDFLSNNKANGQSVPEVPSLPSLQGRARVAVNIVNKRVFQTMMEKKNDLCVAVDSTSAKEVLRVVEMVGQPLVVVKLHHDIVLDWTEETEKQMVALANRHIFLLFKDRKLADIGDTVRLQTEKVVGWADLVTVHEVGEPGVLDGVQTVAMGEGREVGALLVAEMSSAGNLAEGYYTQGCGRGQA